ncbi:hypothetical protein BTM25_14680 [Actinomadura rubteroloni]|uniref:DNA-binding protein n=1 Tax=Actinomadura rubteroloni TaxID=1926885 RepID=A0A2P4UPU0_9ACTN|nr:hypothetical protein [Actinomadura rubteroloni]POM27060.1 hypothetical protein BTM25_14680 [Actinomadura rubteroloni]
MQTPPRVYTRADLMDAHGLGRSTLEKWYRERAANGHPEAAGTSGGRLVWDAGEWDRWYAARSTGVPDGLATRDDLAARHGISKHRLKQLWAEREANGHPEPVRRHGKALFWDEAAFLSWYAGLGAPSAPDDLITLAEAGRMLGLAPGSVTVYASRPPRGWPEPVRVETLAGGRVRRLYRRADVAAYGASR